MFFQPSVSPAHVNGLPRREELSGSHAPPHSQPHSSVGNGVRQSTSHHHQARDLDTPTKRRKLEKEVNGFIYHVTTALVTSRFKIIHYFVEDTTKRLVFVLAAYKQLSLAFMVRIFNRCCLLPHGWSLKSVKSEAMFLL